MNPRPRATRRAQTYEFLHATFGEFLVARLVTQVLTDMLTRESTGLNVPIRGTDDGLLHALLSFAALTARAPIVAFLRDLLASLTGRQRTELADLLLRLHAGALFARTESTYGGYQPLPLTVTARHSAWSTNLALLAVLTAGSVTGTQLFPQEADPAVAWRSQAMMWRSQLSNDEWFGLHDTLALTRIWNGGNRDIRLFVRPGQPVADAEDMYWTYNIPPGHPDRTGIFTWVGHSPPMLERKATFTCGKSDDVMIHALHPLGVVFPSLANVFVTVEPDRPISATRALLAALVTQHDRVGGADDACLDLARVTGRLSQATNAATEYGAYLKTALSVLLAAVEAGAASAATLQPLAELPDISDAGDAQLRALVRRLASLRSPQ